MCFAFMTVAMANPMQEITLLSKVGSSRKNRWGPKKMSLERQFPESVDEFKQ
jgi:hypothetical protein